MGIINWLLIPVGILLFLGVSSATEHGVINYNVNIDTSKILSTTEEEYLSFTLDFALKNDPSDPWKGLNFSLPRVRTLARGLAPAILRWGGGPADTGIFYNTRSAPEQQSILKINRAAVDPDTAFGGITAIFPEDIDNLISLARDAGGRLLYDLNIELRYGPQWDSTNARSLMKYLISKEYHNDVHFELGNEPPYHKFSTAAFNATGERLAKDFLILKRILGEFSEFRNCKLVGMDGETPRDGTYSGDSAKTMKDFVKYIKHNISAITAHHYYFHGPPATLDQFYNITWFKYFETTLGLMRESLYEAAGGPVDIWIGETADSNSGGTPKITDSYASGFLWLDKLGIAAQNEIKLVARQSFYSTTSYNLLNLDFYPNPDYWLSYVFKQLVGTRVLQTSVTSQSLGTVLRNSTSMTSQYRGTILQNSTVSNGLLRVYAHCSSHRSGYPLGSITLIVVNINTGKQPARLDLNSDNFANFNASLYLMTPEDNNLVSRNVQLNGKTLKMVDENTLPDLSMYRKPVDLNNIVFPSLSFGFVVLHPIDIQKEMSLASVCMKL